jgi:hypothetical protein
VTGGKTVSSDCCQDVTTGLGDGAARFQDKQLKDPRCRSDFLTVKFATLKDKDLQTFIKSGER